MKLFIAKTSMLTFLKTHKYAQIHPNVNESTNEDKCIEAPMLPILPTEGYCLIFMRETKYCKLSVINNKLIVERIIISMETENKEHEHKNAASKVKHFINKHYEYHLNQLEKRFDDKSDMNHIAFYSPDNEYIYILISMDDEHIVHWAEKLEIDVLIDPKNAIKKGRNDKEFYLAARTFCPSLDHKQTITLSYLQHEQVTVDRIPFNKWENIHIGFSKHVGNIYAENKIPERQYLRILYDVLTRRGACLNVEYALKLSQHPLCAFFALSPVIYPNITIYFDKYGVHKKIFVNLQINDENMKIDNVIKVSINEFEKKFAGKILQSYSASEFDLKSVNKTALDSNSVDDNCVCPVLSRKANILQLVNDDKFMMCYNGNNAVKTDNIELDDNKVFGFSVDRIDSATKNFENKIGSQIKNQTKRKRTLWSKYAVHGIWYTLSIKMWHEIIEDIGMHYGEANAFYFAFCMHYTKWLFPMMIVGLFWFVVQLITDNIAPLGSLVYVFITVFWSVLSMKAWNKREWQLRYKWGMLHTQNNEIPKPMKSGTIMISDIDGEVIQVVEKKTQRYWTFLLSASTILLCIACVVSVMFGIWLIQAHVPQNTRDSVLIGMLNAVQIQIFDAIYVRISDLLTEWEEHQKRSDEYDSLVIKRVIFTMLNSFNSLLYLAIWADFPSDRVRLNKIRIQLIALFLTAIVIQNTLEIGLPKFTEILCPKIKVFKEWIVACCCGRKSKQIPYSLNDVKVDFDKDWRKKQNYLRRYIHSMKDLEVNEEKYDIQKNVCISFEEKEKIKQANKEILIDIERQSNINESPPVLDNTSEIVVLHGYVILFAMIFPIMPLLAIINNFFELRIDFYNLVHCQRPHPAASAGIGIWKKVMNTINILAIFTNFGLLTFRTDNVSNFYVKDHRVSIVTFFFATVGIMWLINFSVKSIIPDQSKEVKDAIERQKVCEKHLLLNKIKSLVVKHKQKQVTSNFV